MRQVYISFGQQLISLERKLFLISSKLATWCVSSDFVRMLILHKSIIVEVEIGFSFRKTVIDVEVYKLITPSNREMSDKLDVGAC